MVTFEYLMKVPDVPETYCVLSIGYLYLYFILAGQNCTFPCNWHNKDFKWWIGNTAVGFWNFSETTFIYDFQIQSTTGTYECFNIVGRFVIVRVQNTTALRCFVIETNNADSFTALRNRGINELDLTNGCSACSGPYRYFEKLSAVGTVAQNQTGTGCNIPVGCTPGPKVKDPIICDDNGNIEGDCNEATTHPTTPPPPTTYPATPPPKHCKHGHP